MGMLSHVVAEGKSQERSPRKQGPRTQVQKWKGPGMFVQWLDSTDRGRKYGGMKSLLILAGG